MAGPQIHLSTFNFNMKGLGKTLKVWLLCAACFLGTVELSCRVEQWFLYGAPLWGMYSYDTALFTVDEFGIRGKANGVYEKWRLNSFGFRGPEIHAQKNPQQLRVVCIGASETFGLYESPGYEWPRQLESLLSSGGVDAEVVNAAMAGMSFPQRIRHLENRLLRFTPDVVVFMLEYGSYAGMTPEKIRLSHAGPSTLPQQNDLVGGLKSMRSISRLKDVLLPKLPGPVQMAIGNVERRLKLEMRKHELGPRYRSFVHVQPFEIEAFARDLEKLYGRANAAGVKLVLLSPAMWFTERNIATTYLSWPFVDESWWREAKETFPVVARQFAARHHVPFLDLSDVMHGYEADWMKDMLHFNDLGAEQVAQRVAPLIRNGNGSMAKL